MDSDKINILYVDDESRNLGAFVSIFRRQYNVFTATSGQEAIDLIHKHQIALIVTDQRMPEMSGVELLEKIIPEYPDPVRILITGYSDADAVIKAINNGRVFKYISKPWEEKELRQSIDVGVKIYLLEKRNRDYINRMHTESIKQEKVLHLFRKFVPNDVASQVFTENTGTLFAGERCDVCMLMIRVSNLNENITKVDPKMAMEYFSKLLRIIFSSIEAHKGMMNKFLNNEISAFFGAPLEDVNNQKNAAFCALEIIKKLVTFNEEFLPKVGFQTKLQIVLHSGDVIVGNTGAQQYISYSAMGKTINDALLLLDTIKNDESNILVSNVASKAIKNLIVLESLSQTQNEGDDTGVYKILGKKI